MDNPYTPDPNGQGGQQQAPQDPARYPKYYQPQQPVEPTYSDPGQPAPENGYDPARYVNQSAQPPYQGYAQGYQDPAASWQPGQEYQHQAPGYQQPASGYDQQNAYQQQVPPNYAQGPAQPKRQGSDELQLILQETLGWIKTFFSQDYTDSVVQAKNSERPFAWALIFVLYFILYPISQLFSVLRFNFGIGYNAGVWAFGLLQAVLVFGILAGVFMLSQVIFKEFKDWWRPVNAAAVCMLPRLLLLPLNIIFGLFNVGIFTELNGILNTAALIVTIILMLRFMSHNEEKKAAKWITTGMVVLYYVLLGGVGRIG